MEYSCIIGDNKSTFTINTCAGFSNASVWAQAGDTVVLVTISNKSVAGDDIPDFLPLSVEYIEKMYASGKISTSPFIKRERFPAPDAILKARMIDRSIRPLFPNDFREPVQIIVTVLSYDDQNDPLILAINAVSLGLSISDIPFNGPVAALRATKVKDSIQLTNQNIVADPDNVSDMLANIVVTVDKTGIVMIDADSRELTNKEIATAYKLIYKKGQEIIKAQEKIIQKVATPKKKYVSVVAPKTAISAIKKDYGKKIKEILQESSKTQREEMFNDLISTATEGFNGKYSKKEVVLAVNYLSKVYMKEFVLKEKTRVSGRKFDEIRKLTIKTNLLPRVHGSALFQRGNTQILSTVTLASPRLSQKINGMEGGEIKRYMHHYNALSYCYGEVGRISYFPGRREIGHGALAEKALIPVIPPKDAFPYAIRVVSEVLMSAGSTSMASTCGSTLALVSAGVSISKLVAGISVGIVADDDFKHYELLLDIAEAEDFLGGMDYKVTGTKDGITAIQMDNKYGSIPVDILIEALELAQKGRNFVLDKMEKALGETNKSMSPYAPRIKKMKIKQDKIGELIGPSGKNIKKIIEETSAEIDIDDNGNVTIYGNDTKSLEHAMKMIEDTIGELEVGKIYEGKVTKIAPFGVFVQINGHTGLVHVSELSNKFVKDPSEIVNLGDTVKVKVIGVTDSGKLTLSIKKAK